MDAALLPIALPLAFSLVVLLVPGRVGRAALAIVGALATLVAALAVVDVRTTLGGPALEIGGLSLEFAFRLDAFAAWGGVVVAFLAFLVANYAAGWWRGRGGAPGRFFAWLLLAVAGAQTVLMADNLLLLALGWELVTLCLYLLAVGSREGDGAGAVKAFAMLGAGDLALLVAIVLIGLDRGWSIAGLRDVATDSPRMVTAWLLLLVAASVKAGAIPFQSWIPSLAKGTHASVMAFLPGALDKVLGIYLLARISIVWFAPTDTLRLVVMLMGALTILAGVFMAMMQHDLRRLLGFHAVSQVGYMFLGIGTGTVIGVVGGLFHMLNNAIYKACLFLGAGSVERETGTMDLGRLGGLARAMPVTFGSMFVAALAISGIPPLNGFMSKWLVYQSCIVEGSPLLLVAAVFGSALTLASFVKVLHSVFWGPMPSHLDGTREGEGGIGMPAAMVSLAVLCVLLGVFAPVVIDHAILPATGLEEAATLTGSSAATRALPEGLFDPLVLTALLIVAFLTALGVATLGNVRSRRVRNVFVGGRSLDRDTNRFPGTEFYKTVEEMPLLGPALRTGASGRLDPYEMLGRVGRPIVRGLKRLHTGLATDYVAWSLVGAALLFAVLMLGR